MAERRSQRLVAVLMLAEREEKAAATALGEHQAQLDGERQQLGQLLDYRSQYLADYQQLRSSATAQALMSYSGFLQRLGGAISGQEQRLDQVRRALEQSRSHWQEKYYRRQSLEELVHRLRREEELQAEQRLQRELDDMAAQRFSRNHRPD